MLFILPVWGLWKIDDKIQTNNIYIFYILLFFRINYGKILNQSTITNISNIFSWHFPGWQIVFSQIIRLHRNKVPLTGFLLIILSFLLSVANCEKLKAVSLVYFQLLALLMFCLWKTKGKQSVSFKWNLHGWVLIWLIIKIKIKQDDWTIPGFMLCISASSWALSWFLFDFAAHINKI